MRKPGRLARLILRIISGALPTVFGVIVLDFLLLRLMPGDAADVLAGESGGATDAGMAAMRARFGLDQPLLLQLLNYVDHLLHGDLGLSARFGIPVARLIAERLPNTLLLMLAALSVALVLGVVLGWVMAAQAGRWLDRVLQVVTLLCYSTPGFWVGLMAIVLFSVKLGWLPANGAGTVGADLHGLAWLADHARFLVLPAASLSLFFVAVYARLIRSSLLEVQRLDFMRAAAAKGMHPLMLTLRHALPNALIPLTTVAGLHLGNLLGGAVVIETVYGWPGMGRLALEAVMGRDYGLLLGVLLLSSLLVIATNAGLDLLHAWLDPRITEP